MGVHLRVGCPCLKVQKREWMLKLEKALFLFIISLQHKLPVALMYFKISILFSLYEKGEYYITLVQQREFDTNSNIYV